MSSLLYRRLQTPLGELLVVSSGGGLCRISFPRERSGQWESWFDRHFGEVPCPGSSPVLDRAVRQLDEYFAHRRRVFDIPLDLRGTPFQLQVWHELLNIPFGASLSYGEVAGRVGRPRGSQAVGSAVGKNPVPVIVPCHRVLGWDGSLVGFGGGLETKVRLLELEGIRIPFEAAAATAR